MTDFLWWERAAGFAQLVEDGLISRTVDAEGVPHYRLTEKGVAWAEQGDDAEAVALP